VKTNSTDTISSFNNETVTVNRFLDCIGPRWLYTLK